MTPNVSKHSSTGNPFDDLDDDDDAPAPNGNDIVDTDQIVSGNDNPGASSGNPKPAQRDDNTLSPEQRRIQRIREESVRRLTADISQVQTTDGLVLNSEELNFTDDISQNFLEQPMIAPLGVDEMILPSSIAAAIELGVDRELYAELQKKIKHSSSTIGKICNEHSDAFLASIGRVGSLGSASEEIRSIIQQVCNMSIFLKSRFFFDFIFITEPFNCICDYTSGK